MIASSEYDLVRDHAALVDRSERGKLLLTGAEAAEFLQGQVTNDIEALAPGTGCYAALLTPKGKIRADMRVLRGEGWLRIDTEPAGLVPLRKTVRTYTLGRDVRWEDESESRAILSVLGPAAREGLDVDPPREEHAFVEGRHGLYVSTDQGVDIVCPREEADAVSDALGLDQVSVEAAECLRIESGRPRHGVDLTEDTIPQEAGLNDRAVSFTKGCYVGQETVARLHYRGRPNRHLRGLLLTEPARTGDVVTVGDRAVGTIGSSTISPRLGPIALALLRREVTVGATVSVAVEGRSAVVSDLPFAS